MSSISSSRLSSSSLIFLPFLLRSALPAPPSSPSAGLVGFVSFFFCSAMRAHLLAPCRGPRPGLDRREDDPLLTLVLPLPVRVRRLARLVGLEEEYLGNALVGVDLRGQRRRIADLQRHVAFPLGLEGRDIGDDPAPGVGRLPHADRQHGSRNLEVFH